MNLTEGYFLTFFLIGHVLITIFFVIKLCILIRTYGTDRTLEESSRLDVVAETNCIPAKTLYANNPIVKQAIEDLQADMWGFGFHHRKNGCFFPLTNLTMEKNILYCKIEGTKVSVASVLSKECGLRNPRWMNHLIIKHSADYVFIYILFKEYVDFRYNRTFA